MPCRPCATGAENYCLNEAEFKIEWPGLGAPGCMAEYMLVPSPRHLVPLGDLDPVANVPLTDAGLTPYHAIKPSLSRLVPGSTAVVIGVGISVILFVVSFVFALIYQRFVMRRDTEGATTWPWTLVGTPPIW